MVRGDLTVENTNGFSCVGKLVTVIQSAPLPWDWEIDIHNHPSRHLSKHWGSKDSWLRPIRDQPGADESLTWKPLESPIEILKREVAESGQSLRLSGAAAT